MLETKERFLPFRSKPEVDNFFCALTSDSRLLFLAHALKYSIDKALESSCKLIIVDGYYFKYFAGELALGAQFNLVNSLIENFPKPDLVIELNLSIEEAAKRKGKFSGYECGLNSEANSAEFINFQHKAKELWSIFPKSNWQTINSNLPVDEVFKCSVKFINSLI